MLTRMTRMARMLTHMLTRMTRWLAGSHIIHTLARSLALTKRRARIREILSCNFVIFGRGTEMKLRLKSRWKPSQVPT